MILFWFYFCGLSNRKQYLVIGDRGQSRDKCGVRIEYRIRPNYRTYPYKRTVKQFRSLQITATVLFFYFITKAYVVDIHLNCIDLSMQLNGAIQMNIDNTCYYKEKRKSEENPNW